MVDKTNARPMADDSDWPKKMLNTGPTTAMAMASYRMAWSIRLDLGVIVWSIVTIMARPSDLLYKRNISELGVT